MISALPLIAFTFAAQLSAAAPLAHALVAEFPSKFDTVSEAMPFALAAKGVETEWMSAEQLLAIVRHESGFDVRSAPRGTWPRVHTAPRRKHYIAGLLQLTYEVKPEREKRAATDMERQVAWDAARDGMSIAQSFVDAMDDRPGLQSLGRWARICRGHGVRNVTACAVSGHARGYRAAWAMDSELWTYVQRVAARLRARVQRVERDLTRSST